MMKKASALFVLLLSLTQPVQAATPMGEMMTAMIRMMAAMANHMAGSLGGSSSFNMGSNFGTGFNPWMSSWPGMTPGSWPVTGMSPPGYPGMNPWMNSPAGMTPGGWPATGAPPTGYPGWQGLAGQHYNRGPAPSPIEGNWLSQSGEALQVRNNRFRLRSQQGVLQGTLRLDRSSLKLYIPQAGLVMPYRYIRQANRLMLQHPSGQVLYFQQLPDYRY